MSTSAWGTFAVVLLPGRCLEEVTLAASRPNEATRESGRLASTLASAAVPAFLAALDAIRGRS